MRACLVVVICLLAGSQFFGAKPDVYRIAVSADAETDKTEGGELARLIDDELRWEKDVVIVDKSP